MRNISYLNSYRNEPFELIVKSGNPYILYIDMRFLNVMSRTIRDVG